jgi:acylphosphatase
LIKHYNLRIHGRVQGVGYRFSARNMAKNWGIKGFVRNEPDGSVYIEAEGEEKNLVMFLAWCKKGPSMSYVTDMTWEEGKIRPFPSSFSVDF